MSKHTFTFGGLKSEDYKIWLSGDGTFAAPARDVKRVSVPGRNGDLLIDGGKWNNIDVTYPAYIHTDYFNQIEAFRSEICRKRGYQRLEDSYHPDEFRLASFTGGLEPDATRTFYQSGRFDITFNCKPQRFLKSGEQPIQIMPPEFVASEMRSHLIPVDGVIKFAVHSPDTITVNMQGLDGDGTLVQVGSYTCADDSEKTFTPNADVVNARMSATGFDEADDTYIEIHANMLIGGVSQEVNALMGRTIHITNPTGYAAKPLIEVYSNASPFMNLMNYVNGELQDFYDFHVNDTGKTKFTIDCDMQYVYDDDKNNLTNYLVLTTAESAIGEGLTFPQLGEGDIVFYSYYSVDNGLGLVNIYPNWWKL